MGNEDCRCVHEKEFGEITSERRRTDEHMQATWKKIDRLTETLGKLQLVLERQAMQIGDLNSLRSDILAVSKQISEVALDSRQSASRAHERIDQLSQQIALHTEDHCEECSNTEQLRKIEAFKDTMEPLEPVARAVGKVRDNMLVVFLWVLLIIAIAAVFKIPTRQAIETVKPITGVAK